MQPRTLLIAAGIAATLVVVSMGVLLLFGGSDEGASTSVTQAATTSTAGTTTTLATTSSTSTTTSSTNPAGVAIDLSLPGGGDLAVAAQAFYAWIGDPWSLDPPPMADGLATFLAGLAPQEGFGLDGDFTTGDLADGSRVAVVAAGDDVLLAVDDGEGWRIVGAKLASLGLDPWYGAPVRYVMIIGTDARPGYIERVFRADSLHLLASNIAEASGAVVGFPRDAYVSAPYGMDKLSSVNARADSETLVQIVRDLTGLPVEGYLVTGFQSFTRLVNDFGGILVTVPFSMSNTEGSLGAGSQRLWGANALWFARNRSLSGGDFTRSRHQGLLMLGALHQVRTGSILTLPGLLEMLSAYTWTDLSAEALLTMAAGAFEIDPANVSDVVLPGSITMAGGASVVQLDDSAEDVYRDLDDGVLTPSE